MSFFQRFGSEILVNSETFLDQTSAFTIGLTSATPGRLLPPNRFLVTWVDASEGSAIKAQIFNANGARLGIEIPVASAARGPQSQPVAAALPDGGFVIVWTDNGVGDGSGSAIRGQVYSATGNPTGGTFLVNTATVDVQRDPTITALRGGNFVVSWTDGSRGVGGAGGDTSFGAIKAQVFAADGSAVGSELLVNTTTRSAQLYPAITGLSDGGFVISWVDQNANVIDIRAQRFQADGQFSGAEMLVKPEVGYSQPNLNIARFGTDGFVVTWRDRDSQVLIATKAQAFSNNGERLGTDVTWVPYALDVRLTAQANGNVIVTWYEGGVRARIIQPDGTTFDEVALNSVGSNTTPPMAASQANGGFAVVWTDAYPTSRDGGAKGDASQSAVKAQLFSPSLDDVFQPNGTESSNLLAGSRNNDTILGLGGDDIINGWLGDDWLDGGPGHDMVTYADAAAAVRVTLGLTTAQRTGGGGTDTILDFEDIEGSAFNDVLTGDANANRLGGGSGNDRLLGQGGADTLIGGSGADALFGGNDNDLLQGGLGNDRLFGDAGDDTLIGGPGADQLTGGAGVDAFRFESRNSRTSDRDAIVDFAPGVDRLEIAVSAYDGLGVFGLGVLDTAELRLGTRAGSANDRLIYNGATGQLFYDPDGLGGLGQVVIALLTSKPAIQASDIVLI